MRFVVAFTWTAFAVLIGFMLLTSIMLATDCGGSTEMRVFASIMVVVLSMWAGSEIRVFHAILQDKKNSGER